MKKLSTKLTNVCQQIQSTLIPMLDNSTIDSTSNNSTAAQSTIDVTTAQTNLPKVAFVLSNEATKLSIFFQKSKNNLNEDSIIQVLELLERALVRIFEIEKKKNANFS